MDTDRPSTVESEADREWTKIEFNERERTPYSYTSTTPNLKQRTETTPGSFPADEPAGTTGFSSGNAHSQPPPTQPASSHPGTSTHSGASGRPPRPRKCRFCLDIVYPSVASATMPSIPGMAPQPPRMVYEDPELGRLISPCKCKGSSKYVHEVCLQRWRMANPSQDRNYWRCPTCGYQYHLDRLTWARFVQSVPSQVVLTLLVFAVLMFVMGFVADPVLNLYLDPWSIFSWGWTGTGPLEPIENFLEDEEAGGWFEHFFKGMASLGVLGFLKFMVVSPIQFWRVRLPGGGSGGRTTGRDRIESLSWVVILLGIGTTLYGIYTAVRAFSRRALMRTAERVLDVGGDEDDDDDDDNVDDGTGGTGTNLI